MTLLGLTVVDGTIPYTLGSSIEPSYASLGYDLTTMNGAVYRTLLLLTRVVYITLLYLPESTIGSY
jgi:hypothetical protein